MMTLSRRAFALSVAATLSLAIPAFAEEPALSVVR